jgi:hypothetical protein
MTLRPKGSGNRNPKGRSSELSGSATSICPFVHTVHPHVDTAITRSVELKIWKVLTHDRPHHAGE